MINGGRISITMEGRETFLEPTLEACVEISQIAGGLTAAVARCQQMDFETICRVIGAGIIVNGKRLSPNVRQKELPKSIYEAGLFYTSGKAIEFIRLVANGGKLPDEEEEGGEGDDPLSPSETTTSDSTAELVAG